MITFVFLLTGCSGKLADFLFWKGPITATQIESAETDRSDIYNSDCYASYESAELNGGESPNLCKLVDVEDGLDVIVVGDSHAAQWLPAIEPIAKKYGWNLSFFGKRACPFAIVEHGTNKGEPYPECSQWNENLQQEFEKIQPDVLITSNYARNEVVADGVFVRDHDAQAELALGMERAWAPVLADGVQIVVLQDTPYLGFNTPRCLTEQQGEPEECRTSFSDAVTKMAHPELGAAASFPEVAVVNLSDSFCEKQDYCASVIGKQIVWRDTHHMTQSFAESLTGVLEARLHEAVASVFT